MNNTPRDEAQNRPIPNFNIVNGKSGLLLALLCLSYGLSYFDRILMVVLAELVKNEFDLSDKKLSILTGTSFAVMYGLFALSAGLLVDKFNRKTILAWSLSLWSLATMACGFATSFIQLAIARAAVGIGEAANVPVAISMIGDIYKPDKRPLAVAIFFSGGMVSVLASFAFGSWVAEHYGWRYAFLWAGPPGFILALLIVFFTREPTREKAKAISSPGAIKKPHNSYYLIWRNRPLVLLLLAGGIGGFTSVGMIQWLPIFFIRSHGLSQSEIGLLFGPVMAAAMTAGMLTGGWAGNYIAAKSIKYLMLLCTLAMLLIIPSYLAALWLGSLQFAFVFTFIGTCLSVAYSPWFTAACQTICDPDARGGAGALLAFGSVLLGGGLCTFIVGALSDFWSIKHGTESLRYALSTGMTAFCLITAALFARSAKIYREAK